MNGFLVSICMTLIAALLPLWYIKQKTPARSAQALTSSRRGVSRPAGPG